MARVSAEEVVGDAVERGERAKCIERNPRCMSGSACCTIVFVLVCILSSLRTVPAGHLGLVTTFGSPNPALQSPGMHVCSPFASMVHFSVKTTRFEQSNTVPTKEGLLVGLDVALLFRVLPEKVFEIYTTLGGNYVDVLVAPLLASEVRGITSQNDAKVLYNSGREILQENLFTSMEAALRPRGLVLEHVLLRGVTLPAQLMQSIEAKAKAEQAAEQMKFVLMKEQQEAERKTIEARGIAEFQRIVTDGITPALLQWKGIEATEKFTGSPNSKLVIMGNSKASLPVMFSGDTVARVREQLVYRGAARRSSTCE